MNISFEFFPPSSSELKEKLIKNIEKLKFLFPNFVSVTYGAGGSTRDRTHKIVSQIINDMGIRTAAHLTCVNATKDQINSVIDDYIDIGVKDIVALRGDMPDMDHFEPHPQGYKCSVELVKYINETTDITTFVSAYPEKHPESKSLQSDIDLLREKIDAGASKAITQFALDTSYYIKFRDELEKANIEIPVIPGIMPIKNFKGAINMAKKCGISVPSSFVKLFDNSLSQSEHKKISTEFIIQQSSQLAKEGFDRLHFYTLNDAEIMIDVSESLGVLNTNN
mgnify:CR=1 FL=1